MGQQQILFVALVGLTYSNFVLDLILKEGGGVSVGKIVEIGVGLGDLNPFPLYYRFGPVVIGYHWFAWGFQFGILKIVSCSFALS